MSTLISLILSIALLAAILEALGLLVPTVIQLFLVPQLISYSTTIAQLVLQSILHGILAQMKIHL